MYSLTGYGSMLADPVRMEAYAAALRQTIKPGMRVLDLGAGPAVFAMYAAKLGAAEVWAVEPDPVLELGRVLARANGCADKIRFERKTSDQLTDAPRFDVIVSDLRGILPLYTRHLPTIMDVRERLLAPGGTLIPQRDDILVNVFSSATAAEDLAIWQNGWGGLDLSAGAELAAQGGGKTRLKAEALVCESRQWARLDYRTLSSPHCDGTVTFTAERDAPAHGAVAWFNATLTDSVRFLNSPAAPKALYGQHLFLWPRTVALAAGDRVVLRLQAQLLHDDYVWRWDTDVFTADGAKKASFRQSRLMDKPLAGADLQRQSSTHKAKLGARGQAASQALALMQQAQSSGEIAAQLQAQFPGVFRGAEEALEFVVKLSVQYGD